MNDYTKCTYCNVYYGVDHSTNLCRTCQSGECICCQYNYKICIYCGGALNLRVNSSYQCSTCNFDMNTIKNN
jgi:hypothetical protein